MTLAHEEGGRPVGHVRILVHARVDTGFNGAMAGELYTSTCVLCAILTYRRPFRASPVHLRLSRRCSVLLDQSSGFVFYLKREQSVDSIIAGSARKGFARNCTPTRLAITLVTDVCAQSQ